MMELKEAVAEVRKNLKGWKISQSKGAEAGGIVYSCAIPVAETLLAALEEMDDRPTRLCCCCGKELSGADRLWVCHSCFVSRPFPDKPAERPSELASRTVDGWGWKVFRAEGGDLHSELYGKAVYHDGSTIPENEWLDYRQWGISEATPPYAFHILPSYEEAERWVATAHKRYVKGKTLKIRRIAWRKKVGSPSNYVQDGFVGIIFTAEEIYILPEEGEMDVSLWSKADRPPAEPAERPPEKGDWVVIRGEAYHRGGWWGCVNRVVRQQGEYWRITNPNGHEGGFWSQNLRVVRRAADPLRVGDKVAFGSKEGWIYGQGAIPNNNNRFKVNFSANRSNRDYDDDWGWFSGRDLTLVEPVYDRPAEKGVVDDG